MSLPTASSPPTPRGHERVVSLPDTPGVLSNQIVQIAPTMLGASNDGISIYDICTTSVLLELGRPNNIHFYITK
jgi:hypothetical protein